MVPRRIRERESIDAPLSKTFLARLCEQAERYDGKPTLVKCAPNEQPC